MASKEISSVVNNIVGVYRFIRDVLGVTIRGEEFVMVLREVEHIAVHELMHGVIHITYPEVIEAYPGIRFLVGVWMRLVQGFLSFMCRVS